MSKPKQERKNRAMYIKKETDEELSEIAHKRGVSIGKVVDELVNSQTGKEGRQNEPTILVFSNFKGGVSKTTSVKEVGYNLCMEGYKVLLIDLDGQSNLSSSFAEYDPKTMPGYISDVILADSRGNRKKLEEVITHTKWPGLDLVPANLSFAAADNKIRSQEGGAIDRRLLYAIQDLLAETSYDFILIDCPPTADSVVQNAILALQAGNRRSMIIIPVNPDVQALEGMKRTIDIVETISQDNRLTRPSIMVLWTRVDERTNLYKFLRAEFREDNGENGKLGEFNIAITTSSKVGEARSLMEPLEVYAPESRPAERYRLLTDEILKITGSRPSAEKEN